MLEKTAGITYNGSACGCNSVVECLLPKQKVVGSNPITRSSRVLISGIASAFNFALSISIYDVVVGKVVLPVVTKNGTC